MGDVIITYETLYELLMREKSRAEIQKLDNDFFNDVIKYIKDKKITKILYTDGEESLMIL